MEVQEWLKKTLHFGTLVTLTYRDEHGRIFYACCEGFTKFQMRLKLLDDIRREGKFNQCLFKVYPPFYNTEYLKTKKKFEDRRSEPQITTIERREARMELPKLMKNTEEECALNVEQYEKLKGSPVFFGQTVQFLHYMSNKYLTFHPNQVADFESDNLKAGLTAEHGDESYFKFMNCFSFQQETGGYIFDQDTVYILSTMDQQGSQEPGLFASKVKEYGEPGKKRYKRELNISPEKRSFWKIEIFSKYIDDKMGYLSVYDVIWINFSEEDLNLIIQKYSKEQNKKVLKFEGCETTEKYKKFVGNSNGMFIVESVNVAEGGLVKWGEFYRLRHLTTNWYLSVEPIVKERSLVQEEYYDENQASETPVSEPQAAPPLDYKLVAVKEIEKAAEFRFELIYSTLNNQQKDMALQYLEKDSYFRLCVRKELQTADFASQNSGEGLHEFWLRTEEVEPNDEYVIEGSNYIEQIKIPVFALVKKDENVFKLAKANLNEVRMTSYLLSCMKTIDASDDYLNINLENTAQFHDSNFQIVYKRLLVRVKRLERCLFDLHQLCYNRLMGYISFTEEYGQINPYIQNVLREQYFIETLVRILVICFPSVHALEGLAACESGAKQGSQVRALMNSNENDPKSQELLESQIKMEFLSKKKRVCQLVYRLLQSICDSNLVNQEKCALYLPIFAFQVPYIPGAVNTIIQIINDYEELLMNLNKEMMQDGQQSQQAKSAMVTPLTTTKTPAAKKKKQNNVRQSKEANFEVYSAQYSEFATRVISRESRFILNWDLLLYFAFMLKRMPTFSTKSQIVRFLKSSAMFSGRGVNINQELAYKYILQEGQIDQVFEKEVLIRIKSDGPQLKVYRGGDEQSLLDYFHNHELMKEGKPIAGNQEPDLVPYICDIMNLYATMCTSRNYTWKKFAENFFNVESLVENLLNEQFGFELRSIICNMLNRLYVDQEPRRLINWPELCKVVRTDWGKGKKGDLNVTQMSEDFKPDKGELRSDPVDVRKVKEKILSYIELMAQRVDELCGMIDLTQGFNEKKSGLRQIYLEQPNIYNQHTLEMIRMFKLLINFGKYPIRIGQNELETRENNIDFFNNIKYLVSVLEFNTMYPEPRKILVDKRREDDRKARELKLNMFGRGKTTEESKDGGKVVLQSGEDTAEDPSTGESFQKQVQVLNMAMNDFMYASVNRYDTPIKLEICSILNQYMDFKMDFYLNNLKLKFKEWTDKLSLYSKIEAGDLDIDKDEDVEHIQGAFKKQITTSIRSILPQILKTGVNSVDENDPNLNPPESTGLGFGGLANLAGGLLGGSSDTTLSKELQAISLNQIIGFDIFPSLLTIFCMNQNIELETQVLQVLTRLYNQRYEFADLSSKLLLLFDDDNIKIFKKCKKLSRWLAKNVDESETWVQNLSNPDHMLTLDSTRDYFTQFTKIMFAKSYFDKNDELVVNQEKDVDPIRQDIMRHLKIDKLGVDLIKDSVFMVDTESNPMCLFKLKEMFQVAFRFLTYYVKNNPANQISLSQYLVPLLAHMHTDLGQVELFCELFRNNKKICLDRINEVIDDFARLIQSNGRQVRYLEFFMVVHKVRNEFIASNQKAVLNIFIDPRFKKEVFYMNEPKPSTDKRVQTYHTFDFTQKQDQNNPNYRDEPYFYQARLVEVLASCTIGKDGLLHSENKLKALITFRYIMELLLQPDLLTENTRVEQFVPEEEGAQAPQAQFVSQPSFRGRQQMQIKTPQAYDREGITALKQALLNLVFYTYLESEKISEEIFRCLPEINQFLRNERQRLLTIETYRKEFIEYFFSQFMLMINGLIKIFNRELGAQAQQASAVSQQYLVFQQELENLRADLPGVMAKCEFVLTQRQRTLLDLFLYENIMHEEQNKLSPEEQAQIDRLKEEEAKKQQGNQPTKMRKSNTVQMSKRELSTDEIWKELWKLFLTELLDSEHLEREIQAEQEVFAKGIFKVEEIFAKDQSVAEQISKTAIFRRLIAFLEKSKVSAETITTFKLILRVLSNYIEIDEVKDASNLDAEELAQRKEEQKVENQNFLNCNNGIQMVLTLLSDYSDPVNSDLIFNDLVLFAIQLMDGGNNEVQRSVWSYFQNFPSSEVFFMRIHGKIQQMISELRREELDDPVRLFEFQRDSDELTNVLRMLQLFAEGHYTVLQEYMHLQHHNFHNYDLIQDFIELLSAFMKKVDEGNFERMVQNFDTLTEFIQGPCYVNQIAVLQGNFLELATNLLDIDEIVEEINLKIERQNQKNRHDTEDIIFLESNVKKIAEHPFPRWMYARLKYKCSITMISLLEARKDNDIVNRMMKSLNIEVLKRNISDIFYLFQQQYKEKYELEIFNHFTRDPKDGNEKDQDYASFIIETGFNLYIIYQIFLEVKLEKEDRKGGAQEVQKKTLMDYLKDSIIGKLYFMVISILDSFKDMALEMKKKAQMALLGGQEVNYKAIKEALMEERKLLFPKARDFFVGHTKHIEVLREDKNIEKTYFYIPPFCLHLDKENKTRFNESADRVSNKAKVTSLQKESEDIIRVMKLNFKIQLLLDKFKVLAVIVENIQLLRDFEFLLALVINLLIFLEYKKLDITDYSNKDVDPGDPTTRKFSNEDDFRYQELINQMGLLSIVLSGIIVAFFLSRNAPLLIEKAWVGVSKDKYNPIGYLIRIFKTFWYLLTDFFVLYYLCYGAAAVFGTILHPFFFAFHLFEVMIRFPVLLSVVKSVWNPKKQIAYTGLLFVLIMYVQTLLAYIFFSDGYESGFCSSLWECLLTSYDVAFKYDSGLGGALTYPLDIEHYDLKMILTRWFFDNIFNLLLLIILINIVAGIIIDTFGSLREELGIYEQDLSNFCFICGFDKETIEKESVNQRGFAYHIKQEHYQWDYLFYIAYITEKDNTEYTGIESYVADKLKDKEITWFPLSRALCIKKDLNQDANAETVRKLQEISSTTRELKEQFDSVISELDQFKTEN